MATARLCRWFLLLGWVMAAAPLAAETPVPAPLQDWRAWVLHGAETARCPKSGISEPLITQCRWPGELMLEATADGLRFEQSWTLYAPQRVPLPGDAQFRPVEVQVQGRAAPVVLVNERPWLALDAGSHRVSGRIGWAKRPPTLAVPDEVALVALQLDGERVARVERNDEGELLLGATGANEGDDLQLEVFRLLADGVPQMLATRVHLSVSGRPREQRFPPLLPPGFIPVALESEVPARIDADGGLRLQLRSGSWSLSLLARAAEPMQQFGPVASGGTWPAQEIWQFRADPHFRVAQLIGVPGIDPSQTDLPEWIDHNRGFSEPWWQVLHESDSLPAYLLSGDSAATLEVAMRGLPASRPPRLGLQRELWLDFDGGGFSARDRIRGDLGGAARLDLAEPWQMQRAQRNADVGLLITAGPSSGLSGVELRDTEVDLEIDSRVSRDGIARASGWTHAFDSASAELHLPPGYRLIAATGVDRAAGSWWEAWSLLDLFLLSIGALLAWRLGGVAMAAVATAWLVLAWHEPDAPRISVLLLLLATLLAGLVQSGRAGTLMRGLRHLLLAATVLLGLGFAATELRLALYPQLERPAVINAGDYYPNDAAGFGKVAGVMMEPAPVPQSQAPMRRSNVTREQNALDKIEVTGARIKTVDLFSYPSDAVVQNGLARPSWQWQRHHLGWSGPLLADDEFGLILSPPWVTRLWRVLAVLLLLGVLWRVLRVSGLYPRVPGAAKTTAAAALMLPVLALAPVGSTRAQSTPDADLLSELRTRLLARDEVCRPDCSALGEVALLADGSRLLLVLDAQAQAEVIWPLPRPDASLALTSLRVDGKAAPVLRLDDANWVHLERGVHRIEAGYSGEGERWRIAFPLAPAAIRMQAAGFEAVGLDLGRLVGDTLELVPPRVAAAAGDATVALAESVPPFVRVERSLVLDQHWEVEVKVRRIAPARSGLTVAIPLLTGEQPYANAPTLRDGQAMVSLPTGVDEISWRSRLSPAPQFTLRAGDGRSFAEEWRLIVSPLLHVQSSGIPEAGQDSYEGAHRFLPLPGETLALQVSRPEAVQGARVAIEDVNLRVAAGNRARDTTLSFQLRATQAGQHAITLPPGSELLSLHINGQEQPRVLDDGVLRLPLRPATQRIALNWREPVAAGARISSPAVALGASASNLRIELVPPQDRWLLLTRGPTAGPAVLYWGELLVMILAAAALARATSTPLRFRHWLLLGLGFSTLSWIAAGIVAGWLLLMAWRARRTDLVETRWFGLLQIALVGWSGIALLALLIAVPYGLLGRPDMHIVGNGSDAYALRWFADRSDDGTMPVVQVFSLPLWVYKGVILAWSLWLANALFGWLRWAWSSLTAGGGWRPIFRRKQKAPSTPEQPSP